MDVSVLWNLLAWSVQIALIVALGGLAAAALRIDAAPVRYAWWRALLALCLVLPWLQGRHAAGTGGTTTTTATFEGVTAAVAEASVAQAAIPWAPVVAVVIGSGIVGRLLWLGAGLLRLRRLRSAGRPASPDEHAELQRALGTCAAIRYAAGIRQPVTFGTLRPVVLLPETLRERASLVQRAVVAHELFHVQRRDWIWTLGEEIVRAAFWFHPAMWWVISRVQLSREEAVDELVVLATGQRRTYLEALLAFADEAPLAPAAAFARRRHLYRRMMLISKEAVMSARRVVITCAVLALVVAAGSWYAVGAFPMLQAQEVQGLRQEPGPVERSAKAITPENPIPRRIYAAPALYPQEAIGTGAYGMVTLRVALNELGRIAEMRRLSTAISVQTPEPTPRELDVVDAFVRSAAQGVGQWIFDPPADGPIAFEVTLRFSPDNEATLLNMGHGIAYNVSPGARAGGPPPPPPPPPPSNWGSGALRVGGAMSPPTKTRHVNPVYPAIAQSARVQGVVILEVLIQADGRVGDARVLRSIPLLDQAAVDAVRQWEFTPTLLNGAPVPIIMTVTVAFTLT